ncbi:MAG: hypothetical protein M3285_08640 [Actinomycetota bacterium]|nr:hypothetical protein [Actinomycetota bacterium]
MADLHINTVPVGATAELLSEVGMLLDGNSKLQSYLGPRARRLSIEFLEDEAKPSLPLPSSGFRATYYDYSNARPVQVVGGLEGTDLDIASPDFQPKPNNDEFAEAVAVISKDEKVGPSVQNGGVLPYRAMPGVVDFASSAERTLAVGLLPKVGLKGHEIVGVNLVEQSVVHYDDNAPPSAAAHNPVCGLNGVWQATTDKGTPGQAEVTVTRDGAVLWRFVVVRPSASSGIEGSAVELRSVDYRSKRVLDRAHAPILNVKYDGDACGPYRDWQWEEGAFAAVGSDVANGIRFCTQPAQTILDSGKDRGDFRGVAIYADGPEVVLKSELEAGWYRYISEWRLHEDGTIRPRFGFSAVKNSCVCTTHHHHIYWRFDFDIHAASPNRVLEYNFAGLPEPSGWVPQLEEAKRLRDEASGRKWRVENPLTAAGYTIVPGHEDGTADAYGQGDVWILRFNPNELDDGQWWTSPLRTQANLDKYVNGETVEGADVVFWYATHFSHEPGGDEDHGHRAGPDLIPHNWTAIV